jgi:outer membrane lipoprotein SlyB
MRNITKIALISTLVLSLGACQTNQIGTGIGALVGGAGGGYAAHKFLGQGQGKMVAAAGGAVGGALLGGLLGNSLTLPYTNRTNINNNAGAIYQNGQRIDGLQKRIDSNGNVVYVQPSAPSNSNGNVVYVQPSAPSNSNSYNCKVVNNYVVCND